MSEFYRYQPEKGDDESDEALEKMHEEFQAKSIKVEEKAKAALIAAAKEAYPNDAKLGTGAMSMVCLSMAGAALFATMKSLERNIAKGHGAMATGLAEMLLDLWDEQIVPMAERLRKLVNEANGK